MSESTADTIDYTKERLKFETEFFKQLATLFLLAGSATTTLFVRMLSNFNWLDLVISACGGTGVGVLIFVLRRKYKLIYKLIGDLN